MHDVDRRFVLRAGLAAVGAGALAACGLEGSPELVAPGSQAVRAADARRRRSGRTRSFAYTAVMAPVDLGGVVAPTWSYDGVVPGKELRVTAGDELTVTVANQTDAGTSVHWHGLALRNDADGVPGVTQAPIPPRGGFTYRFVADTPGTYWFHPHAGIQLDRGLYVPLIVEDPREPLAYDDEWVVVLDDWLDGVTGTPDEIFDRLRRTTRMHGMHGGGSVSPLLGGGAGDVEYPHYLLNGRVAAAPVTFAGRPRRRVRIRFVNAGSDTAFRVALGGHRMTVTHTDGYPVEPVDTDALLIGMGERYDVVVTLDDGVFPLVALAEGKRDAALGLVRTGAGSPPPASMRPAELDGRVLRHSDLRAEERVRLPKRGVDVEHRLHLTGGMMRYDWGINGRRYDPGAPVVVEEGQRVRLTFTNRTMMWHPMHVHGHTFQAGGAGGPRKDTVAVLPGQTVTCDLQADNPGQWMIHCHNAYHAEAGLMTLLGYRA